MSGRFWSANLTPEQVATAKRIRRERNLGYVFAHSAGWTVFVTPTTLPARYLELRHHMFGGRVARWVIERDGTVSAHNDEGSRRELTPA